VVASVTITRIAGLTIAIAIMTIIAPILPMAATMPDAIIATTVVIGNGVSAATIAFIAAVTVAIIAATTMARRVLSSAASQAACWAT